MTEGNEINEQERPAEGTVRDIRRKTRKQYTAEEKIRIVVSGLRGEESIAALCRREGIAEQLVERVFGSGPSHAKGLSGRSRGIRRRIAVGPTLDKLGIPKTTFYRWYDRFLAFRRRS